MRRKTLRYGIGGGVRFRCFTIAVRTSLVSGKSNDVKVVRWWMRGNDDGRQKKLKGRNCGLLAASRRRTGGLSRAIAAAVSSPGQRRLVAFYVHAGPCVCGPVNGGNSLKSIFPCNVLLVAPSDGAILAAPDGATAPTVDGTDNVRSRAV